MQSAKVKELLLQSLEHEFGGIRVYEAAIECAVDPGLKENWRSAARNDATSTFS